MGFLYWQRQDFSFCHHNEPHSGAHLALYPVGFVGSFPGVKWPEPETDHSLLSSAEVKNVCGAYLHFSICLQGVMLKHNDSFTFFLIVFRFKIHNL
jgi:hypothetical protein